MVEPHETASTGIDELDSALGGLYRGDNVVWETEEPGSAQRFYLAVAARASEYEYAAYATLSTAPDEIARAFPGFDVVDARAGSELAQAAPLLNRIRSARTSTGTCSCSTPGGDGRPLGRGDSFFARASRCCSRSAVAYWSLTRGELSQRARRQVEDVTQCVISIGESRVRIAKAEGRPVGAQGSVSDGKPLPLLDDPEAGLRAYLPGCPRGRAQDSPLPTKASSS